MTRISKREPSLVAGAVATDAAAEPASEAPGAARTEPTRRRRGAPRGNTNAAKDRAFTRKMRDAQRLARRGRKRRHSATLADARRVLSEAGLAESPLGERIAARLADVELEIDELGRIVDRAGRMQRGGALSPAYEKRLGLIREDRAELRALVDRLAELKTHAAPTGETVYTVRLADGTDLLEIPGVEGEARS